MPTPSDIDPDWTKQNVVKVGGVWTVDGRPSKTITVAWNESPSTIPGKAYVGFQVTAPVNAATPPHRHAGAAVAATVIKGRVLNQMVCADGTVVGPKIYETGESWYEAPGCHHVRCSNAGDEEAMFIAAFVIDEAVIKEKGPIRGSTQFDADEE